MEEINQRENAQQFPYLIKFLDDDGKEKEVIYWAIHSHDAYLFAVEYQETNGFKSFECDDF